MTNIINKNLHDMTNVDEIEDSLVDMTLLSHGHSDDIHGVDRIATSIDLLSVLFDRRMGQLLQAIDKNTNAINRPDASFIADMIHASSGKIRNE